MGRRGAVGAGGEWSPARLEEILGRDGLIALSRAWGGRRVTVPTLAALVRLERDRRVCQRLDGGESYRSVARGEGLSVQSVQRIAKRYVTRRGATGAQ